jgi:hypothetical protein
MPSVIGTSAQSKGVTKMEEYVDMLVPKTESTGTSPDCVPVHSTTVPATGKKQTRVYQCPECHKTFVKNSNFKQHLGQ